MSPRKIRVGISWEPPVYDLLKKHSDETGAYLSTIANQAVVKFFNGEGHSESLKGKVTVIQRQQSQRTLGNLMGSYEKEDRQIAKINRLEKEGRLTKEESEQYRRITKSDYAKSRAALKKQTAEEEAAKLEDPDGKYADMRLRIQNARDRMAESDSTGELFFRFNHCGLKWEWPALGNPKQSTSQCPKCKGYVTSTTRWRKPKLA